MSNYYLASTLRECCQPMRSDQMFYTSAPALHCMYIIHNF